MLPQIYMEGRLTAEVDLRFTPNGKAVANFTVACNDRQPDGHGGWKDGPTCFLRVSVWNKAAENAAETLRKGMLVTVHGRLEQQEYEKDGQKRTSYQVGFASVGVGLADRSNGSPAARDSDGATARQANDVWGTPAPAQQDMPIPF